MKIISYAWTTDALLSGNKTVTRRFWTTKYAKSFKVNELVQAWSKSPRFKGRKIAIIRLTKAPYLEYLRDMPESDVKKEGGLWKDKKEFVAMMGGGNKRPWVIRHEIVKYL